MKNTILIISLILSICFAQTTGGAGSANEVKAPGLMEVVTFKLTTSPTNEYVLTTDASGNGSWQAEADPSVDTHDEIETILVDDDLDLGTGGILSTGGDMGESNLVNVGRIEADIIAADNNVVLVVEDSTNFSDDVNIAGSLGIGMTSPAFKLDVIANVTDNVMLIQNNDINGFSAIRFNDNSGVEQVAFGYGNASSSGPFTDRAYWESSGTSAGNTPKDIIIVTTVNNVRHKRINFDTDENIYIYNWETGSANVDLNETPMVTFDGNGKVGIGQTVPSVKLEISELSAGNVVEKIRLRNASTSNSTGSSITFHTNEGLNSLIKSARSTNDYGTLTLQSIDNDNSTVASEILVGSSSSGTTDTPFILMKISNTEEVRINSDGLIIPNPLIPANANATGTAGTISWDDSFIYICIATDTWERVAIASW